MVAGKPRQSGFFHTFHTFHTFAPRTRTHVCTRARVRVCVCLFQVWKVWKVWKYRME